MNKFGKLRTVGGANSRQWNVKICVKYTEPEREHSVAHDEEKIIVRQSTRKQELACADTQLHVPLTSLQLRHMRGYSN